MAKSISTLCILFFLFGCSKPKLIVADLAALQKNTEASLVETGNFGGGTSAKGKSFSLTNAEIKLTNDGSVMLNFTDTAGGINFSPDRVKLPSLWEKCTRLAIDLKNENPSPVTVSFGIRGRWLRAMNEFTLQSGESKTIYYPLGELSLIGPKESPFSPSFIGIDASGKAMNWKLKINSLALETEENWNPEPVVDRYGQRKKTSWEGKITSDEMLKESLSVFITLICFGNTGKLITGEVRFLNG